MPTFFIKTTEFFLNQNFSIFINLIYQPYAFVHVGKGGKQKVFIKNQNSFEEFVSDFIWLSMNFSVYNL